jgi:hypothetical protein
MGEIGGNSKFPVFVWGPSGLKFQVRWTNFVINVEGT